MFPSSFPDLDHFNADSDPFFDVDQDSDLYHAFNPKLIYLVMIIFPGTPGLECENVCLKSEKKLCFFYLKKMLVQYHYIFLCRHNVALIAMRSNRRYANS